MLISRFADGEIEAVAFNLPLARSVFVDRSTPDRHSLERRDATRHVVARPDFGHHDLVLRKTVRRNG